MGRPRKANKDIELLKEILRSKKDEIVNDGHVVSKKNQIWIELSIQSGGKWSALALYTLTMKNYYNINDLLGITFNEPTSAAGVMDVESTSTDEGSSFSGDSLKARSFTVFLSDEEYKSLNIHTEAYNRNALEKYRKSHMKNYKVFGQQNWTTILYEKLDPKVRAHQIPCTFFFKRNKIYPNSLKYFAICSGKCKECMASIVCTIRECPSDNEDVPIEVKVFGENIWDTEHKQNCVTLISGNKREKIGNMLAERNIAPSQFRRTLAADSKEDFRRIPSLSAIKQVKHEHVKLSRLDKDPIIAIWKLKIDPNMKGAIQNIGLDPFFVYFWTNTQIHAYNNFCKKEYAKICIDATGNVVSKIKTPFGEKSSHIFLYDITVRSLNKKGGDNQYSVSNMLSESQNAISIYTWMANWMRAGATKPQEVVTDMSLALMYACILAFSKFKTLKEYVSHCYNALLNKTPFLETCYIRNDVAHFIKLVTQWPCLKNQHRLTKQFYVRSVCQLVQSTDILDAENLLKAIFFVAFSDTEGHNIIGEEIHCELKKKWLIRRCSTGTVELIENFTEEEKIETNRDYIALNAEYDNNSGIKNEFEAWAQTISEDCKILVNKNDQIGDRGNQQHLPNIEKEIQKICKTLPLWSAIMKNFFPLSHLIGSSASVESNINNIKHRIFANKDLPLRVDEFIEILVKSNEGQAKLVSQKDTNLVQNNHQDESGGETNNAQSIYPQTDDKLRVADSVKNVVLDELLCPSCQLRLSPSDICINCKKEVHQNALCSTVRDDLTYCIRCSKLEETSVENWRGQGTTSNKRRPRNSYLEPSSELLEADFTNVRKISPIGLLKNGHLTDLKPIKISSNFSITLSNTCAFDSLIQILASSFCDSFCFKELMIFLSESSKVAEMVCTLVKSNVTKKSYRLRALILETTFNQVEHPFGIIHLNVETEIGNLLPKLDLNFCVTQEIKCDNCSFFKINNSKTLEVEVGSNSNLRSEILAILTKKLRCKSCQCGGSIYAQNHVSPVFFFVEVLNLETKIFQLKSNLDELPKKIDISGNTYVLRGVIGYEGSNIGVGHFVAYCFRHNNMWEEYDDLAKYNKSCSKKKHINCQLLLYTA